MCQDFRGLRKALQQFAGTLTEQATPKGGGSLDGSSVGGSSFTRYAKSGTPFDSCPDTTCLSQEENILDVTVSALMLRVRNHS